MPKRPTLVLFDGQAIVHRGYHALPPLTTGKGEQTNAVYGFALIVLKALQDIRPDYAVVAWDAPGETFRHGLSVAYKATRTKAPEDLSAQFDRVQELCAALGLPVVEQASYEADDVIATLVRRFEKTQRIIIVTGDMDALQLVSGNVTVYLMRRGLTDLVRYTPDEVVARYGLQPGQIVHFKALRGDASDNIPGVPGIGEKTATALLQEYGSLEGVYDHLSEVPERWRKLLSEHRHSALLSEELSVAASDLDFEFDLESARVGNYDRGQAVELFRELEFKSLLDKLPGAIQTPEAEKRKAAARRRLSVIVVQEEDQLEELARQLRQAKHFAFDTETDSLDPLTAELVGISISFKPGEGWYVPLGHREGKQLSKERVLKVFRDVLASPVLKIAHNLKFDLTVCQSFRVAVEPPYFDTMLAGYLLSPGSRASSLENLSFQELGEELQPITELIGTGRSQRSFAEVAISEAAYYAAEDAEATLRLYESLAPRIRKEGLEEVLDEIEHPLVPVLARMERWGIRVDTAYLAKLGKQIGAEISRLERSICKHAGAEFNINSPRQLAEVLYERLGLRTPEIRRGKSGFSTAASELEKLKGLHPIIEELFLYRELVKLKNTYIDALPTLVSPADGRLHTDFNQAIAATGRLSSSNPNLQNIPIRTEQGRAVRRAFVADPGHLILSADYSQIELRIIAHLAEEEALIEAFRRGADIHTETAALVSGVLPERVTREMRYAAKAVNFGIMYGLSAHGLAASTGMSREEAGQFIKRYFELYPRLRNYIEETKQKARESGFVTTLLGRKRYLPEIKSSNFAVRGAAERMAINMPVQGTAADIMKLAMIALGRSLPSEGRLLLQVHDELVLEVEKDALRPVAEKVRDTMTQAYSLTVPLAVDTKAGPNWEELSEVAL